MRGPSKAPRKASIITTSVLPHVPASASLASASGIRSRGNSAAVGNNNNMGTGMASNECTGHQL